MPPHRAPGALSFGLLFVLLVALSAEAREKWGPFRGQIVDAETGHPIAGTAVLVVWWEAVPTPVQTNKKFFDAKEAVTDSDGRFEVPRLSPPFFGFKIFDPAISYFAPGYGAHAEVVTPADGQPFVASTVIQMRRLSREELLRKSRSRPSGVPLEKMVSLTSAINAERAMLGLQLLPLPESRGAKP